ncbi:PstS family phosphate ABC transporter substrate-binding protein [Haliangium sp.]|uniref:PstS family phosphate ABC transporter substrate-binding protein n=1 Tax=Haliangium sp. TaxID=2663208 RepID=UPI003D0B90AC
MGRWQPDTAARGLAPEHEADLDQLVEIDGALALAGAIEQAAAVFGAGHPEIVVSVAESTSLRGIHRLVAAEIDLALSARPPTPAEVAAARERGMVLKPYLVAHDAIAVIVHPDRYQRVAAVSREQLEQVFISGRIHTWSQLNPTSGSKSADPIRVYACPQAESGVAASFVELLTGAWETPFVATAVVVADESDILASVARDVGGIGFVPLLSVDPRVRALAVGHLGATPVAPSAASVRDLDYPLRRRLFVLTRGTPVGPANHFIRFLLEPEGQATLARAGLVPLY